MIAVELMPFVRTGAAILLLVAISTIALRLLRVRHPLRPAVAVLRGAIQLLVLALILSGIIADGRWVAVFLAVMFPSAVIMATRRVGRGARGSLLVGCSIAAGVLVACSVIFATGAIEFSSRYVLALGSMIIGGSMTVCSVVGRGFSTALTDRWDEVEGWLALGATPRQASIRLARTAAETALLPLTDQARTTGIVVLPGAFIGAIFGGLSPVEAGLFQITVLAGLIAAGSIVVLTLLIGMTATVSRPSD